MKAESRLIDPGERLRAIADMVSPGHAVCDVGADHAYLCIYLVQRGAAPRALALDNKAGPVRRAKENIASYGLDSFIGARVSDGLTGYVPGGLGGKASDVIAGYTPGEPKCKVKEDASGIVPEEPERKASGALAEYTPGELGSRATLVCAGMGGWLIRNILEKDPVKVSSFDEAIFAPQSDVSMFRRFLRESGFTFLDEDMVCEDGHFYPIMKVAGPGIKRHDDATREISIAETDRPDRDTVKITEGSPATRGFWLEDAFGPILLKKHHPILKKYLERYIAQNTLVLSSLERHGDSTDAAEKMALLKDRLKRVTDIYNSWDNRA